MTLGVFVSCSTNKNTALTRQVQAFKARYNTYFNGNEAFKEGRLLQEEGNKDNFTELIPLYATGNKATIKIGTANFINPAITVRVAEGIDQWLDNHGCSSVKDIIGQLEA